MDNFASFRSESFTAFARKFGIQLKFSAVGHASSQGQVERTNQTLKRMLKKYIHEHGFNWDTLLPFLLFAINEAENESTKFSPSNLVYGHRMRGLLAVQRHCW